METTTNCWSNNVGKLLLRVTVGGLLLMHGVDKIMHPEYVAGIKDAVAKHNLPESMAYGVYVGEVLASSLVLIGLITRVAAVVVAINMGVAVWLAHMNILWTMKEGGGWAVELQAFYFLCALCILFLGPGQFSFDNLLFGKRAEVETLPPATK
jgi:putative oxidoreductase